MKIRNFFLKFIFSSVASLPFRGLYILSDLLTFTIQYLTGYRRRVIYQNLQSCFPGKNAREIKRIQHKFYRNFSDLLLETVKSSKMSKQQVEERVRFKNQEILDDLYNANKNVFVTLGHCGNWEWAGNKIALFLKHEGAAIYKPIRDKFFDDYMINLRQKYKGTIMIDFKKVFRTLVSLKDKLFAVFVLADQSPARTEMNYFIDFFGQSTAFYDGMEKVARALNYAVVYMDIQRVGRGYYEVEIIPVTNSAKEMAEGEVMQKYVQLLEQSITNQPDNWLWSHRRWKQKEERKS